MKRTEKIDYIRSHKIFARGDVIVFAVLIILIVVSVAAYFGYRTGYGNTVCVYENGVLIEKMPLSVNAEYEFVGEDGRNLIRIENGTVFVVEADCKDKICQKSGRISAVGETIICLPHGLKIVVTEENNE